MIFTKSLTFNAIAIFIGVLGGLSAFVTMFIDVESKISVKWLLLMALIAITLISILVKIAGDIGNNKPPAMRVYEKPINSKPNDEIYVIRVNPLFNHNSLVGGYHVVNDIETISFLGYVFHVQEKLIQIKLIKTLNVNFDPFNETVVSNIIIRPVIPFETIKNMLGEI